MTNLLIKFLFTFGLISSFIPSHVNASTTINHELSQRNSTIDAENDIYGFWWLNNPKSIGNQIVAGALGVCDSKIKDEKCDGLTLVIFERNGSYGCTDFVGKGNVIYKAKNNTWDIILDDDFKKETMFWGSGKVNKEILTVTLIQSGIHLTFDKMSEKEIEDRAILMCSKKRND